MKKLVCFAILMLCIAILLTCIVISIFEAALTPDTEEVFRGIFVPENARIIDDIGGKTYIVVCDNADKATYDMVINRMPKMFSHYNTGGPDWVEYYTSEFGNKHYVINYTYLAEKSKVIISCMCIEKTEEINK